jgi:site-specific recombinase XerD
VQAFLGHSRITTTERYMHAKARPEDVDLVNRAFRIGEKAGAKARAK